MSSKKSFNRGSKQPFLYIINSINNEFDINKYEASLKQYNPLISFVFQFYPDIIKAFFAFNNEISKEELCRILNIQNSDQIIQIPQLPEKDFDDFPDEIIICPIPQCFHKLPSFDDFLNEVMKDNYYEIYNKFDYRIIRTDSNYYSTILYQFFNNIMFDFCSPKAFYSKSCRLPIIFITNIPKNFDLVALVDAFQYYLNERVVTRNSESPLEDNNLYSTRLTFENFEIAQKAVEMFNYAQLDDVEISVNIFCPMEEYLREMKEWKLIIEGIPEDLSSMQLFKTFSPFGKIYKAYVKKKPEKPKYGIVQYFDKDDAMNVIKKVNQATLNECIINVFRKIKIRINNFSSITEEEIQNTFSDFNPLSNKIINNKDRRPSVILTFRSESEASEAIEIASKMNSIGMKLLADYEPPKPYDYSEEKSLFLSGLPSDYTQIQLIDLCKVYGLLSNAEVRYSQNSNKTLGFVEYDSHESSENALKKMEGLAIDGNPVQVVRYKHKRY